MIDFSPLFLKDSAGAKLEKAVFTYQGQAYEINLNGLGVGGASGQCGNGRYGYYDAAPTYHGVSL